MFLVGVEHEDLEHFFYFNRWVFFGWFNGIDLFNLSYFDRTCFDFELGWVKRPLCFTLICLSSVLIKVAAFSID